MPVEIRELIVKTEITSGNKGSSAFTKQLELNMMKKQILEECKRMIAEKTKQNSIKR
jgi:hypothetical protein